LAQGNEQEEPKDEARIQICWPIFSPFDSSRTAAPLLPPPSSRQTLSSISSRHRAKGAASSSSRLHWPNAHQQQPAARDRDRDRGALPAPCWWAPIWPIAVWGSIDCVPPLLVSLFSCCSAAAARCPPHPNGRLKIRPIKLDYNFAPTCPRRATVDSGAPSAGRGETPNCLVSGVKMNSARLLLLGRHSPLAAWALVSGRGKRQAELSPLSSGSLPVCAETLGARWRPSGRPMEHWRSSAAGPCKCGPQTVCGARAELCAN